MRTLEHLFIIRDWANNVVDGDTEYESYEAADQALEELVLRVYPDLTGEDFSEQKEEYWIRNVEECRGVK